MAHLRSKKTVNTKVKGVESEGKSLKIALLFLQEVANTHWNAKTQTTSKLHTLHSNLLPNKDII